MRKSWEEKKGKEREVESKLSSKRVKQKDSLNSSTTQRRMLFTSELRRACSDRCRSQGGEAKEGVHLDEASSHGIQPGVRPMVTKECVCWVLQHHPFSTSENSKEHGVSLSALMKSHNCQG